MKLSEVFFWTSIVVTIVGIVDLCAGFVNAGNDSGITFLLGLALFCIGSTVSGFIGMFTGKFDNFNF